MLASARRSVARQELELVSASNSTNPSNPNLSSKVVEMSDSQVARMKKRCVDVLRSSASYDQDLRQLCLLIARR
jgi:hypothetical protein